MHIKRPLVAALAAVGLGVGLMLGTGLPASATDHPETKTVSWLIPGYTGTTPPSSSDPTIWTPEQILYTEPVCGIHWIQTDDYRYKTAEQRALVDALIAKGTLGRVNGQPEDSAVYLSHTYTQQEPCIQPPDESTPGSSESLDCVAGGWIIKNWHDVVTYSGDASGWTANPPVRVNDPDTTRPAEPGECIPDTEEPPVAPPTDTEEECDPNSGTCFVETGVKEDLMLAGAVGGPILGLVGGLLVWAARRRMAL